MFKVKGSMKPINEVVKTRTLFQIDRNGTPQVEPDAVCTICLESLPTNREEVRFLNCLGESGGHAFCEDCFQGWEARGGTIRCPVCRREVNDDDTETAQSSLVAAVVNGDINEFRRLLDSTDPTENENEVVFSVIHANDNEMLSLLIEDGRVDFGATQDEKTPLELCLHLERYAMVRNLLSVSSLIIDISLYGENEDGEEEYFGHILEWAVARDQVYIVETLLNDDRVDYGDVKFVLETACRYNRVDSVRILLSDGRFNPNENESECITITCLNGYYPILELLLQDGRGDPTVARNGPLVDAIIGNHERCVALLVGDDRVDPTKYEYRAIEEALRVYKQNDRTSNQILEMVIFNANISFRDENVTLAILKRAILHQITRLVIRILDREDVVVSRYGFERMQYTLNTMGRNTTELRRVLMDHPKISNFFIGSKRGMQIDSTSSKRRKDQ